MAQLELTDFRSWPHAHVAFETGPNLFIGPNGHGKTNLVEALVYLSSLRSHRVSSDAPLVRAGSEQAVIRTEIFHDARRLRADLAIIPGRSNQAKLNGTKLGRPRELLGALRAVAFTPEDLSLVRGEPSVRRRYLDEALTARQPRMAAVRSDYDRVLKQRNTLLRTSYLARKTSAAGPGSAEMSTLDAWDAHLATLGGDLMAARLSVIDDLVEPMAKSHADIADGRGDLTLDYRSSLAEKAGALPRDKGELTEMLHEALGAARKDDLDRGTTTVGPHRDDMDLTLGGLPVKGYASHGETWSVALAMRLGLFELLAGDGVAPILILDDVFAELDERRRLRLAEYALGAPQTLITCAVASDVPPGLDGPRFTVLEGSVERA